MAVKDLPIACELTAAEMRSRREELLPGLLAGATERVALPDGFRWRFAASGELLAAAAKTIDAERRCCRFLRFVLTVEPDARSMWLEITGPTGTSEFLDALSRE
jgi:hypothetical protein